MGLLTIVLIVAGVLSMTDAMRNVNMGSMSPDKTLGFIGLAVAVFGLLKFLFVLTESPGYAAFIGLVLLVAIGWGAWQKIQSSGGFQMRRRRRDRRHDGWRDTAPERPTTEHASDGASAERWDAPVRLLGHVS